MELQRKLNKIASDMDAQALKQEIQRCYLEALEANPSDEKIYHEALAEAERRFSYHRKQWTKLNEERLLLTPLEESERRRSLNTELIEQRGNTMSDVETQTAETQEQEAVTEETSPKEAVSTSEDGGSLSDGADTVTDSAPTEVVAEDSTDSELG